MNFLELVGGVIVVTLVFGFVLLVIPRAAILLTIATYLQQVLGVRFSELWSSGISSPKVNLSEGLAIMLMIVVIATALIYDVLSISVRVEKVGSFMESKGLGVVDPEETDLKTS